MKARFLLIFFFLPLGFYGQTSLKSYTALRIEHSPRIDGTLDDACWKGIQPITDFTMFDPVFNMKPSQRTAVRIAYDDNAIYVGAMMYDRTPDSILHELGNRDDELNADHFGVEFDTYNMQTDAYTFVVTASGVQSDFREEDETYNAVWQSATHITDSGWIAEMKIPYSAIRFPNNNEPTWGLQIFRTIRRDRETDEWALEEKGAENALVFWGKLDGIKDIKAPLRLSVTPYLSLHGEHFPYNIEGKSDFSGSYSGGLDLKWGINESYTVDMTLLPDFSQVQSDDLIKNITAFETEYDEYRPFFNEGIDLFQKGDLFYSRRIGKVPRGFYDVEDSLAPGEYLDNNPGQAKLLNAAKISGRNKKGTGLGIFNALTDNMYAKIMDTLGNKRKLLTEPLTNYNILVFDQIMKNNSDIYVINTSVMRSKGFDDANVTGSGLTLNSKNNTWQFMASAALSQKFHRTDTSEDGKLQDKLGYRYYVGFGKVKGNFHFLVYRNQVNNTFDINDLGLIFTNGETENALEMNYNIYKSFGSVKEMFNTSKFTYREEYITHKPVILSVDLQNAETFLNYLTLWNGVGFQPIRTYDFYEPRIPGRYYHGPAYYYLNTGFSTDYRKRFALDFDFTFISAINDPFRRIESSLTPIIRVTDKFSFNYTFLYTQNWNDVGFTAIDTAAALVIFGKRELMEIENALNARYIFKNDLSVSLRARHFWSIGEYEGYYTLLEDGELEYIPSYGGVKDYDFNYNSFNIDLVFSWQFAPGSSLNVVWKNAILEEGNRVIHNYWDNIRHTFDSDQLNSLSVKVLYYLDYQYLRKKNKKGTV
jgi:hypothetical protein